MKQGYSRERAEKLAKIKASSAARAVRNSLNDAAKRAGRSLVRRSGGWLLKGAKIAPGVTGVLVFLETGNVKAAANEVCMDIVGPVGMGRDGGLILGAGYEYMVEETNRSAQSMGGPMGRPSATNSGSPGLPGHGVNTGPIGGPRR